MGCRSRSSSRLRASGCSRPRCCATASTIVSGCSAAALGTSPCASRPCASTIDWSYELLEPDEQRLFELLAAFADADVTAVESVADDVGAIDGVVVDVLDGLAGLVEKSLLRRVDDQGGEPRVAMLQTIRAFATDRLEQRPDVASRAHRAHATHYAELAGRLRAELGGAGRDVALHRLAADVANLRIAWAYWVEAGDLERLDQLAKALLILDDAHGWYLDTVGLASDMLAVLDAVPSSSERINQEIALRTTLARALMATKGFTPEVEAAFASALERFERGVDVGLQFSVLRGLASLYLFRAQLDKSAEIGEQILALGEAEGDAGMLIDGHLLVGTSEMSFHHLQGGLDHLDQAIALFPEQTATVRTARVGNDPRVSCLTTSAITLWMLGRSDRAAERADAALALAAALDHPFTSAYARYHAGLLRLWLREPDAALTLATGLLDLAEEHEFRIWTAAGTVLRGAARVEVGRSEDGLADVRAGIGLYGELRSPPIFWPFLLFVQARACASGEQPAEGLQAIDRSIEIIGMDSGASLLPELAIVKGDLLRGLSQVDGHVAADAEPWYRQALDLATELGALTAQLRASTRLARLRVEAGDPVGATSQLGPIVGSLSEGFDTADLREARELLEAVATP